MTIEPAAVTTAASILVAEDDPDLLSLLVRRLTKVGYRVTAARDGAEALLALGSGAPDAVILDVMMPKVTGIEVARQLRSDAATSHVPVILISAGFRSDWDLGVAGEFHLLAKPFGVHEIQALLREVLAQGP